MTERLSQRPEINVINILKILIDVDPKDCSLSSYLFQQPTIEGLLRSFHVTRVSTVTALSNSYLGKYNVSLDFIRPKSQTDYYDPPFEGAENPLPAHPFYRLSTSRLNDIDNPLDFIVDEAFESNARIIHQRLIKDIYKIKKDQGKVALEEIATVLEALKHSRS